MTSGTYQVKPRSMDGSLDPQPSPRAALRQRRPRAVSVARMPSPWRLRSWGSPILKGMLQLMIEMAVLLERVAEGERVTQEEARGRSRSAYRRYARTCSKYVKVGRWKLQPELPMGGPGNGSW